MWVAFLLHKIPLCLGFRFHFSYPFDFVTTARHATDPITGTAGPSGTAITYGQSYDP